MTCRICGKPIGTRYQFYCGSICASFGRQFQGRKQSASMVKILQALRVAHVEHNAMALDTRRDVVLWLLEFGLIEQPAWWGGTQRYRISEQGLCFLDWVESL